jgi:hypothetical protein
MSNHEKITWEQLRREIDAGHPGIHRIMGAPNIDVFIDEGADRIGIRVPVQTDYKLKDTSPLAEVQITTTLVQGKGYLQVTTGARQVYPEFVSFINSAVERISVPPANPESAIIETLRAWRALLAPLAILSEEQQIGLWGELFILRLMIGASQPLSCWVGPQGEPHDFRLGTTEMEIKTTRNLHRIHIISNLDQLSPSAGRRLFLISLQTEPAGAQGGETLNTLVLAVCQQVATIVGNEEASTLRDRIRTAGYREEHSGFYLGRLALRTLPRVVFVDDSFPRITKDRLENIVGKESHRIGDVQYRINVDGLGVEVQPDAFVTSVSDKSE